MYYLGRPRDRRTLTLHRLDFTASGLVDEDPYRCTVCRVGLDGSGFAKLTDDDLDHVVTVSENKEYFIDSASTVDTPPVTRVRDWDFLVRELMGVQPPAHRPAAIPLDPESLGEMFA